MRSWCSAHYNNNSSREIECVCEWTRQNKTGKKASSVTKEDGSVINVVMRPSRCPVRYSSRYMLSLYLSWDDLFSTWTTTRTLESFVRTWTYWWMCTSTTLVLGFLWLVFLVPHTSSQSNTLVRLAYGHTFLCYWFGGSRRLYMLMNFLLYFSLILRPHASSASVCVFKCLCLHYIWLGNGTIP